MTKVVKLCSIALSFVILMCSIYIGEVFSVKAASVTKAYVAATNVNIRKTASTKAESVAKVSNATVTVLGSIVSNEYSWYNVEYNGKKGYIRADDYVRITEAPVSDDTEFENNLKNFPQSYHASLRYLHSIYPNWKFVPDKLTMDFQTAVNGEASGFIKLVNFSSDGISWRSCGQSVFNWSSDYSTGTWNKDAGNWTGASKEVVAYYMDPRNFLNANTVYMFLQQSYDAKTQTEAGLEQLVEGTFLAKGYSDSKDTAYGGSYIKLLMEAGKQSGVSPYILACTIILEQGVNGSKLSSGDYKGYEGYYNFFNFNANGDNPTLNGLIYAKSMGWNTRSKAIIEGAKRYSNGYLSIGQDTYFYKDFNLVKSPYYQHQYAQSVYDARSSGFRVRTAYNTNKNAALTFRIPVYKSIPNTVTECPEENNKLNNYYIISLTGAKLTPTFSMYKQEYALAVNGSTTLNIKIPPKASYASAKSFKLNKGNNKIELVIKAETGYTNTYVINVESSLIATLEITVNGSSSGGGSGSSSSSGSSSNNSSGSSSTVSVILGDTNGDKKITIVDLANVQKHLLGKITLKGNNFTGADTNKDKKITIIDLANIQKHLLGKIKLGG